MALNIVCSDFWRVNWRKTLPSLLSVTHFPPFQISPLLLSFLCFSPTISHYIYTLLAPSFILCFFFPLLFTLSFLASYDHYREVISAINHSQPFKVNKSIYWNFERNMFLINLIFKINCYTYTKHLLFILDKQPGFFSCRVYFIAIECVCFYKCSTGNPSFRLFTFEFKQTPPLIANVGSAWRAAVFVWIISFLDAKPTAIIYPFELRHKDQKGWARMSADTRKKPAPGDAEALCTTGETAELEKSQERRGRIFSVSSQNIFFTVFLNWIWSTLDAFTFLPQKF